MRMRVIAPAKINRFLWIGPRDDRGYHPIVTGFQSIGLADVLTITWTPGDDRRFRIEFHPPLHPPPVRTTLDILFDQLIRRDLLPPGIWTVTVQKRIPAGSGLGGGSADAVAVLYAITRMAERNLSYREMVDIARGVGMDVPFFLVGGRALGMGYGDIVWPLPDETDPGWIVLVIPNEPVSTAEMYTRLDRERAAGTLPSPPLPELHPEDALRIWLDGVRAARNDFQPILERRFASLTIWHRRLRDAGAVTVQWTGSGAAFWGWFPTPAEAWAAAARLQSMAPPDLAIHAVPVLSRTTVQQWFRGIPADF